MRALIQTQRDAREEMSLLMREIDASHIRYRKRAVQRAQSVSYTHLIILHIRNIFCVDNASIIRFGQNGTNLALQIGIIAVARC